MAGLVLGLVQFMVADDRATHHEVDEAQQDEADDGHHDHRLEVLHEELVLERPGALLELRAAVLQRIRALLQRRELRVAFEAVSKGEDNDAVARPPPNVQNVFG